jgi:hypothetical protein
VLEKLANFILLDVTVARVLSGAFAGQKGWMRVSIGLLLPYYQTTGRRVVPFGCALYLEK